MASARTENSFDPLPPTKYSWIVCNGSTVCFCTEEMGGNEPFYSVSVVSGVLQQCSPLLDNSPKTFGSRLVALQHCSWAIWEVPSRHSSSDLASFTKTRQFEGLYTPYFRLVGNKVVFVAESLQAVYTEFWWKWKKCGFYHTFVSFYEGLVNSNKNIIFGDLWNYTW